MLEELELIKLIEFRQTSQTIGSLGRGEGVGSFLSEGEGEGESEEAEVRGEEVVRGIFTGVLNVSVAWSRAVMERVSAMTAGCFGGAPGTDSVVLLLVLTYQTSSKERRARKMSVYKYKYKCSIKQKL